MTKGQLINFYRQTLKYIIGHKYDKYPPTKCLKAIIEAAERALEQK